MIRLRTARKAMCFVSATVLLGGWSGLSHPVHISSTQIDLGSDRKSLEVTVRIFTDDLEEALFISSNRRVRFGSTEATSLDSLLSAFLAAHLRIIADEGHPAGKLLGHERSDDAVLAYIEVPITKSPSRITVENRILLELFADQSNIVHVNIGGRRRSALLRRGEERAQLQFD